MSKDIESSFLLFETLNNGQPSGHASGCLVEYKNKKYFFSVEHAVKKANFYLQKKYIPKLARTELSGVGQFNRIGKLVVNEQMKNNPFLFEQQLDDMINDNPTKENFVDFAYKEITDDTFKLNCFFQLIIQENFGTITRELKKKYFKINQKIIPKKNEICKFAGFVLPTTFPSLSVLTSLVVVTSALPSFVFITVVSVLPFPLLLTVFSIVLVSLVKLSFITVTVCIAPP